jgi:capsid assembly protease
VSGSIGVVMMHADYSRSLDAEGITPTLIFAGDHKVDGNPLEPLSDEVKASLQAEVDSFYGLFVDQVAQGRSKMSAAAVRATQARTFIGQAAVDAGLADAVGTFDSVLAELSAAPARPTGRTSSTRTASSASMSDPVSHADHVAALATASTDAAKAAGTRISGILGHAEAEGRSSLARHLAFDTDMSVEAAAGLLAKAAKEGGSPAAADAAALAARAGATEQTLEGLKAASQAGASQPGKAAARIDAAGIYASRRKEMGQG